MSVCSLFLDEQHVIELSLQERSTQSESTLVLLKARAGEHLQYLRLGLVQLSQEEVKVLII